MTQTDRITVDGMVAREVNVCLSYLVSTLAGGYGADDGPGGRDLAQLAEQAFELASPIDDWEEAAIQAGYKVRYVGEDGTGEPAGWYWWTGTDENEPDNEGAIETTAAAAWEDCCRSNNLDPYQREVFEFWAVSPWLADKLEARGEKVDRDFTGLCVWARTTSGQGIISDSVILAIYNEMMEPRL